MSAQNKNARPNSNLNLISDEGTRKLKLLILWEYLDQETDFDHQLSTTQICNYLIIKGYPCHQKTLAKDILLLIRAGYPIVITHHQHDNTYYVEERFFESFEIRLLIDAVQAANFIPPVISDKLAKKLARLGGRSMTESLQNTMHARNRHKHSNMKIIYTIDALKRGIEAGKKVSFYYFHFDENRRHLRSNNGERYCVTPVEMLIENGNYYLVANCSRDSHTVVRHFRLDRMESVDILENDGLPSPEILDRLDGYTNSIFSMYDGELRHIILEFDDSLADTIFDKFGEDTHIVRMPSNKLQCFVTVAVAPTFWGWLFKYVGRMRIAAPQDMIDAYKDLARLVLESDDAFWKSSSAGS